MSYIAPSHEEILDILADVRTIALIGASDKPERPSHGVMRMLQHEGFKVIPVNPSLAGQELLGEDVYASLTAIPANISIDMVDIFRNSEAASPVVDEAIEREIAVVWMQLEVINEDAAKKAMDAGARVVMDRCPAIELRG